MTRWQDQSDPCDTGVSVDDDYLNVDSRDQSANEAYVTNDGADGLHRGESSGNGEHWANGQTIDRGVQSNAATLVSGMPRGGRKWRLHHDLNVAIKLGDGTWFNTADHIDTVDQDERAESLLLEAKICSLDLPRQAHDKTLKLVREEDTMVQFNIKFAGHRGAIIGYASYVLNPQDLEQAKAYAASVADTLGVGAEQARGATEYAFKRIRERFDT